MTTSMGVDVSIIIPCLNEARTIGQCVFEAKQASRKLPIRFEILVVDNNSTDNSAELARKAGAKVIFEKRKGYGRAYKTGLQQAKGTYIFMADGDGTYDFSALPQFYYYAKEKNYDFVIGNRFSKKLPLTTMPALHQYVGNPVLSALLRLLFGSNVQDAHCGMRLLTKQAYERMQLTSNGMEFASEMVIKAAKYNLTTKQIPISYSARKAPSKLRSFRDGWRHLRFMLIFSPTATFIMPGLSLILLGLWLLVLFLGAPLRIGSASLSTHPALLGSLLIITGNQLLLSGYFLRVLAVNYFQEKDQFIKRLQHTITLDKAMLLGAIALIMGAAVLITILTTWLQTGFGELNLTLSIIGFTCFMTGVQLILNSFYYISIQAIMESAQQ
jgi:glycosyltransferase involved in cell wall biosynthesis